MYGWKYLGDDGQAEIRRLQTEIEIRDSAEELRRQHPEYAEGQIESLRKQNLALEAEIGRLRRVNGEWGLVMTVLIDGLAQRNVKVPLGHRYTKVALSEIDRLTARLAEAEKVIKIASELPTDHLSGLAADTWFKAESKQRADFWQGVIDEIKAFDVAVDAYQSTRAETIDE